MILSRLSRKQTVLRPCRAITSEQRLYSPKATRRRLHNVPQLTHDAHFTKYGVGGVMSPAAFNVAWHDYHSNLVNRLNEMTVGHPSEDKPTKDILQANARNPNQASLFNHASMAWNNHHFFSTLSPDPQPMSGRLKEWIGNYFSSVESFQKQFIATAMGMFGPGFVWLIRNPYAMTGNRENSPNYANDPAMTIMCTYIAGSPIPGAHPRAQTQDMSVMNSLTGGSTVGRAGMYSGSEDSKIPPGRMTDAHVCLGVCTWEHAWILDHGVSAEGKRKYLEEWWKAVDWKVVEENACLTGGDTNPLSDLIYGRR